MTTKRDRSPRVDSFRVEHDRLIRSVVPRRGKPYEHTCKLGAFREVLWAGEDLACGGFTIEEIADHADLPITQVAVAIAFLDERGSIEKRHRRNFPANRFLYEDGMIEFMALKEKGGDEESSS